MFCIAKNVQKQSIFRRSSIAKLKFIIQTCMILVINFSLLLNLFIYLCIYSLLLFTNARVSDLLLSVCESNKLI